MMNNTRSGRYVRTPDSSATAVTEHLKSLGKRIVFAESCTCGLLAAAMGRIPGASGVLCGSLVTYRTRQKHVWLGVREAADPDADMVTAAVADQMAVNALKMTPEADLSAAVTGHLGPDAPTEKDGLVFSAVAVRCADPAGELRSNSEFRLVRFRLRLAGADSSETPIQVRHRRQQEVVDAVFDRLLAIDFSSAVSDS